MISAIIAHRGASKLAPENTLAALRKAYEIGAKWVEFDVMLTADGEAVVIHDETLERTTNGRGLVSDFSSHYLRTLDAGSWFGSHYANEKIPTLLEVIKLLHQYGLTANIEIKPANGREEQTVKAVLQIIQQNWHPDIPLPLISSFSPLVCALVKRYAPSSLLAYLMDEWQADWQEKSTSFNCIAVNVNHEILTSVKVSEIKKSGRLVLAYTVDDVSRARELFAWGVDSIFSNCPIEMQVFLN